MNRSRAAVDPMARVAILALVIPLLMTAASPPSRRRTSPFSPRCQALLFTNNSTAHRPQRARRLRARAAQERSPRCRSPAGCRRGAHDVLRVAADEAHRPARAGSPSARCVGIVGALDLRGGALRSRTSGCSASAPRCSACTTPSASTTASPPPTWRRHDFKAKAISLRARRRARGRHHRPDVRAGHGRPAADHVPRAPTSR